MMDAQNYFSPQELYSIVKAGYAHLEESSPAKEQADVVITLTSATTVKFTLKTMNFLNMTVKFTKPSARMPFIPDFVTFSGDNAFSFNCLAAIKAVQRVNMRHVDHYTENIQRRDN